MDLMNKQTTKQLSDLEFMIEKIYKEAGGQVIKDLEKVMAKLDTDLTPQQQLNYLQQKKRLESLLNRLVDDINNANIQAIQMLNDELIDTYINNQKYGAYLVEHNSGFKVDWALYNKRTIKQIMLGKDNLFYQMALDNLKDKDLIYRALQRELVQSILLGESIPKIAKRVQKVTGRNMNDSIRIARTETTRAENSGRFDSYKQAEKQGLKLKKKWLSTIDGRTRERHVAINNQERNLDETFSNGLMFPGDNGPASEVVNCRCTSVVEFEGLEKGAKELELDDKLKKMSYDQWNKDLEKRPKKKEEKEVKIKAPKEPAVKKETKPSKTTTATKKPVTEPKKTTKKEVKKEELKYYTKNQLNEMNITKLKKLAEQTAKEFYPVSGINFGNKTIDQAISDLMSQDRSKASLIKDIHSMQQKLKKVK